jgi:hypothetical protein
VAWPEKTELLLVCLEADVLIAGLVPHGCQSRDLGARRAWPSSAGAPEAAVAEVRRTLAAKLPEAAPVFEESLRAVPVQIHRPTARDRDRARELADAKDVPILAAAIGAGARLLVTHNLRHFRSGEGVRVVRPRTLIEEARAWMGSLGT